MAIKDNTLVELSSLPSFGAVDQLPPIHSFDDYDEDFDDYGVGDNIDHQKTKIDVSSCT